MASSTAVSFLDTLPLPFFFEEYLRICLHAPCTHMAGPRSPFPLCYLDKVVGFLVPRSKASYPVPVPRSPFRFFVPRSGSPILVYRFITLYQGFDFHGGGARNRFTSVLQRQICNFHIKYGMSHMETAQVASQHLTMSATIQYIQKLLKQPPPLMLKQSRMKAEIWCL